MNGTVVRESYGAPRRNLHNDDVHEINWWKAGILFWGIITSICGHIWLGYMAWQLIGAW